jgi:rhodanese-related sulfurtransferase
MNRLTAAILGTLAVALAAPASAAEEADPTLVAAGEKVLATMPADFYQVEPAAAQQLLEAAKPFLLDVREEKEFAAGRIAGSTLIPLRTLPTSLAKLPQDKAASILVYCKTGVRGAMALVLLRMWGYTDVRGIKGGIDGWEKANLPLADKRS